MKKPTALGISRSGGARNPHVFQHTLGLLVPSLGLAPAGLALRFAPGETVLCSGGPRSPLHPRRAKQGRLRPRPAFGWRSYEPLALALARDGFFHKL
ncbi:MAG: hypothetical protein ACREYE_24300 [Gammaproteobacteria bacterium]